MSREPPRVALVTGATGAIGGAIAEGLAADGWEVVLACRDEARGSRELEQLRRRAGGAVRGELLDVSRPASVRALAARWSGPLHALINNAALAPRRRQTTENGWELVFSTNVLGYFWMTRALAPVLVASAPARVVNVASYWAGDLDLEDLEFCRRPYDNTTAYRQSKQANRMLTRIEAERFAADAVTVNACHPGDVSSKLSKSLGFGGHQAAAEAARTPLWLAGAAAAAGTTGRYFEDCRAVRCRFAEDGAACAALYGICERYVTS